MKNKLTKILFWTVFFSIVLIQLAVTQEKAIEWFKKGEEASEPDMKIHFYQKAIELDPDLIEAHYKLALVYKIENNYEKAIDSYNRALEIPKKDEDPELKVSMYYELGICYKRLNDFPKSSAALENALNLAEDKKIRSYIYYELGRNAVETEDFEKAFVLYNEGMQLGDENTNLFQNAIEDAKNKGLLKSNYQKGLKFLDDKDYESAIQAFSQVVEIDKEYKDVNLKLAEAKNGLSSQPDSGRTDNFFMQASDAFSNGDFKIAVEKYKRFTEQNPNNSIAYYNLGQCYEQLGDNALAIAAYQKALMIKENYVEARVALERIGGKPVDNDSNLTAANNFFLQKKYGDAIKAYLKYLKEKPKSFEAHFNLAYCYEQNDDLEAAIENYKKALYYNKKSKEAVQALARVEKIHLKQHLPELKKQIEDDIAAERFPEAKSKLKQFLEFKPDNPWAVKQARIIEEVMEGDANALADEPEATLPGKSPAKFADKNNDDSQDLAEQNESFDEIAGDDSLGNESPVSNGGEVRVKLMSGADEQNEVYADLFQSTDRTQHILYLIIGGAVVIIVLLIFILRRN